MQRCKLISGVVSVLFATVLTVGISAWAQKGKPPAPPPPPADPAIVYVAERAWSTTDLVVMNADGSNKKVLIAGGTGPTSNGHHDPSWSPDSNRIAFCFNHDLPPSQGIFLINKDGSGLCKVVDMINACPTAGRPQWSPDGRKILYADAASSVEGNDLFLINAECDADPQSKINLTKTQGIDEFHPSWSADGSKIAVVDWTTGVANIFLYDVSPDWSAAVRGVNLTDGSQVNFSAPKWSQSSPLRLLVTNGDIQAIDVNSPGNPTFTNLTRTTSVRESWPAWSPFDRQIVYGRENGLWVMNADGSGQALLVSGTQKIRLTEPDWRRTP